MFKTHFSFHLPNISKCIKVYFYFQNFINLFCFKKISNKSEFSNIFLFQQNTLEFILNILYILYYHNYM